MRVPPRAGVVAAIVATLTAGVGCETDEPQPLPQDVANVTTADAGSTYENCFNGRDDNADRLVDCADPQCRALDACRTGQCPDGDLGDAVGLAVIASSTSGVTNDLAGTCGGQGGPDLAFTWTAPASGDYFVDTRWGSFDTIVYVREGDCDGIELACNDDATAPPALESEVVLSAVAGRTYVIVVDGYRVVAGPGDPRFVLNITPVRTNDERGFCTDRRDNDDDLLADCADPDCADAAPCLPLSGARDVSAGQAHTCATGDGAWCWGRGNDGELGDGAGTSSRWPVAVPDEPVEICAGSRHSCSRDALGSVSCWGDGWYGNVPSGDWGPTLVPVRVALRRPAVALACGASHACAILDDGTVQCWGANGQGQLGDGSTDTPSGAPTSMIDIGDIVAVAVGGAHTCVVRDSGQAWCTGSNNAGQLGVELGWAFDRPQPVEGIEGAAAVAAGAQHTCFLLVGGAVRCVGQNWQGQLGDGSFEQRRHPVSVRIAPRVAALDCGAQNCCAVDENADVWCWGANGWGQLGAGDTTQRAEPLRVQLRDDAVAVSVADEHVCAVLDTGEVTCWGGNRSGQLGDGTVETRLSPVPVLAPR